MAIDRGAISRTQDTTFVFSDGCRAVRLAVNLRCPRGDTELKAGNDIADRCGSRGAGLQSLRLQRPGGLLVAHGGPTRDPALVLLGELAAPQGFALNAVLSCRRRSLTTSSRIEAI